MRVKDCPKNCASKKALIPFLGRQNRTFHALSFLGLSLPRNHTEMLAAQATYTWKQVQLNLDIPFGPKKCPINFKFPSNQLQFSPNNIHTSSR